METTNTPQTVLVTGASRGIGREIALRLARDGYNVAVGYAGNRAKAEEVVQAIEIRSGKAVALQVDVADEASVAALFEQTQKTFGNLTAVVHCAGIMEPGTIADGNVELFDRTIATNLRGAFLVLSQAAKHVSNGGRIVALSTSVIGAAYPTYGPYAASKAGVEALVRVLANELRGRSISVNAVAPGPVGTELFLNGKSEEQIVRLSKIPPLERLGTPEDIAGVVAFLLGPEGGWINAQILRANGGFI